MARDILYLLAPGFEDQGPDGNLRREYCPECAEIWGLLSYFPAIQQSVDIHYMPIDKPRPAMVERLGDKNQNCPTLVLNKDNPRYDECGILRKNGHYFINNARDIGRYYAHRFGTPVPRG